MADGNLAPVNSRVAQIDPVTSISDLDGRFDETRQMDGSADTAHNVDDGERQDGTAQKIKPKADERQTPACQSPTEFQVGGKCTTAHVMTRSTDRGDTDRHPTAATMLHSSVRLLCYHSVSRHVYLRYLLGE